MLLDLSRIRTSHEHDDRVFEPSAFTRDEDYTIAAPVRLVFDIYKDKETYRLVGRVQTTLQLTCSRCLEPFAWPVDEPFELTYEPRQTSAAAAEREIHDEDFSNALYDNQEIDLDQLVRERFEMSMPMKPLCGDACKGLCPVCGTNLNRATCDCRPDWEDPRFAALKSFRVDRSSRE